MMAKRNYMSVPVMLALMLSLVESVYSSDLASSRFCLSGDLSITGNPESLVSEDSSPKAEASGFRFCPDKFTGPLHFSSQHRKDSNTFFLSAFRNISSASTQRLPPPGKTKPFSLPENKRVLSITSHAGNSVNDSAADRGTDPEEIVIPKSRQTSNVYKAGLPGNHNTSNFTQLKRAGILSLAFHLAGMGFLQAVDAWDTGHRPFSDAGDGLYRAWTMAPEWDEDPYFYNFIGHPYTGSFTYNLMRSQNASPLISWLFSCSQSLIWEFIFEATEQQPSIQDLLITSNVGSLLGEGFHRLTGKMRKNGLSPAEKFIVLIINPGHVLNNGFR
jgi:hypothetical protein